MYWKNVYSNMTVACPACKDLFQIGGLWFIDDKLLCLECLKKALEDKDEKGQPTD